MAHCCEWCLIDQVFDDPQVQHLGLAQTVQHPVLGPIQLVGQPFTLSQHSNVLRTAPPERGQDTVAVLTELGLSTEGVASLRVREII